MQGRPVIIVGGLIGLVLVGAVGWWLISPLFITQEVDEPFPIAMPSEAELTEMPEEEREQVRQALRSVMPSEEEMAEMSEEEQQAMEAAAMAAAATIPDKTMDDPMPEVELNAETAAEEAADMAVPEAVLQGAFQDADDFHQGSGSATLYVLPDGNHLLRFEMFEVTNGPDLRVLLSSNPMPTDHESLGEYIELGSLKGNVGNQNYDVPEGTDVSQFQSVVIYCKPFSVVFSTATLTP